MCLAMDWHPLHGAALPHVLNHRVIVIDFVPTPCQLVPNFHAMYNLIAF